MVYYSLVDDTETQHKSDLVTFHSYYRLNKVDYLLLIIIKEASLNCQFQYFRIWSHLEVS